MAEGAHRNNVSSSLQYPIPTDLIAKPVISNRPLHTPFCDWAYPSLPLEQFMDKVCKQNCGMIPFLGVSAPQNNQVFDSTLPAVHKCDHEVHIANHGNCILHVSGLFSANGSTFTPNSFVEECPVLAAASSRNKMENCPPLSEIVNGDSFLHEQKESGKTLLAFSTIPTLNAIYKQDAMEFRNLQNEEFPYVPKFNHTLNATTLTVSLPLEYDLCESGWTAYLNTMSESWTPCNCELGVSNDLVAEKDLAINPKSDVEQSEDSSLASDASSGPERPVDGNSIIPETFNGIQPSLKRFLNEAAVDGIEASQFRPRKLKSKEIQVPLSRMLEDTATSSLQLKTYGMDLRASRKWHNIETGSAATRTASEWQSEAVNNQIRVFEELTPDGMEAADSSSTRRKC